MTKARKKLVIDNDLELKLAVQRVDELLEAIHDYAGTDFSKDWKIRFPRGYVRSADQQRARLPFLPYGDLKSNFAYTLMLSDTLHWLLMRTDVTSTLREQIIKLYIFLFGSMAESLTLVSLKGRCGKKYNHRIQYMCDHKMIDEAQKDDLEWLWKIRNKMHLFLLDQSDYQSERLRKDFSVKLS